MTQSIYEEIPILMDKSIDHLYSKIVVLNMVPEDAMALTNACHSAHQIMLEIA